MVYKSLFKYTRDEYLIIVMLQKNIYFLNELIMTKQNIENSLFKLINKNFNKSNIFQIKKYFFLYNQNIAFKSVFKSNKVNFYLTDSFTRSSKQMLECSKEFFFNKYTYLWN